MKPYLYNTWYKLNDLGFFTWFIVFAMSTGIIVCDRFTPIYINNFYVRLFFYLVSASLAVFWIGWIFFGFKAVKNRIYIFISVLAIVLAKALLTWGGDWKTQIVLYENKLDRDRTIEFQMRGDPFSFGYRKQIVEKTSVMPFLDYVRKTDTTMLDDSDWTRTDIRVNQLKLDDFTDAPSN